MKHPIEEIPESSGYCKSEKQTTDQERQVMPAQRPIAESRYLRGPVRLDNEISPLDVKSEEKIRECSPPTSLLKLKSKFERNRSPGKYEVTTPQFNLTRES